MHWTDEGLVIGTRPIGESGVVLEAMTRAHGRHLGLVHGGRSRRLQPVLQPGNTVRLVWRARLDDQLGSFVAEPLVLRTHGLIGSGLALAGASALCGHLRLLAEREPHPRLFDVATVLADHLPDPGLAPLVFARFELMLLAELGFGLDLSRCAATGTPDDLAYVSPRTGRAVGRVPGEPYRERLLPLPAFLVSPTGGAEPGEIGDALRLTGHFLALHVYEPRGAGLADERRRYLAALSALAAPSAPTRPDPAMVRPPTESEGDITRR